MVVSYGKRWSEIVHKDLQGVKKEHQILENGEG